MLMKKLLPLLFLLCCVPAFSQLLSSSPEFIQQNTTPVVITMDASKGNQELFFYTPATDVYVHIGVITNLSTSSSDWRYSKFTWGTANALARATSLGGSKWSYTISGDLRNFFGITDPAENIEKIALLFRNGTGARVQRNTDGSDMYIPVSSAQQQVRITTPFFQPTYVPTPEPIVKNIGESVAIVAKSPAAAELNLYFNGNLLNTQAAATEINANPVITAGGNQQVVARATQAGLTVSDTLNFYVGIPVNVAPLPPGVQPGINYTSNTTATLVLVAPGKNRVCVIGEFAGSEWREQATYQMNRTPDGNYWWLNLTGLTPGHEYAYQYLVDGTLKIADPYAEKILDPWNDIYISNSTYPGLRAYPAASTTGIVSLLQTAAPVYNWDVNNFQKPDKRNLVIYELLVRDFVSNHNWNTLRDTLNYLKRLGVNAIEIMPFNEFEGNESWGYNPDFYFAPDKYYGPANSLKELIDSCHKNGIAVLMDIALNHSFGQSPMVQLYWDAANNRPAPNNPWFNPVPRHAFNVGYDINHEKAETRYYVSRIMAHWLQTYRIDGFRWDLSKGFTQTQTCDNNGGNCNVNNWSAYDASRVAIWKKYYDSMQLKSPGSYCILEHFADNTEEQELSGYGMMLWGNSNYSFNQATMGYNSGSDFSDAFAQARNWSNPYLVSYMESHDEERLMYKNIQYGNASGIYNIKNPETALKRQEMAAAFFLSIPGPKMIWQFGELGYDYSINYCTDGSINDGCRTGNKPIRWDYLQQPARNQLFNVYSKLIRLRTNAAFADAFVNNTGDRSLAGNIKWIRLEAAAAKIMVVGNFDVVAQNGSITFPQAGIWYDYLLGTTINATGAPQNISLQPGEYHVYTSINAALPLTLVSFSVTKEGRQNRIKWTVTDEEELLYYEIEKSSDGQRFSTLQKITPSSGKSYTAVDNEAGDPVLFYRLKMTEKNGRIHYSEIVKITREVTAWLAKIRSNPFVDQLIVGVESPAIRELSLVISDAGGRQLILKNISLQAGNNSIEVPETRTLASGVYILQLVSSNQHQSFRVVRK